MAKKNQKYRKQQQRQNFPWLFVALGGGLLLLAAILFANRSGDGGGTPSITVDQQKIDYGYVKFGETRSIAVKVTNTGDGNLRFKEQPYIEVVEGCGPPQLTIGAMVLNPGESTVVQSNEFMMHEGMDGPHNFAVHLKTNDPNNPDLVVNVISDWGPGNISNPKQRRAKITAVLNPVWNAGGGNFVQFAKLSLVYPLKLYKHAPSRIDGICQPQHTMLLRSDWPNSSTKPAADFAPIRPACRSSSPILWPANSVYNLSFVTVIQNTQFAVTNLKREKTMRTTIWRGFLIWFTVDPMASVIGKPGGLRSGQEELNWDLTDKSHVDRSFKPPDSQPT